MKILNGFKLITTGIVLCSVASVNARSTHQSFPAMLQAPEPVTCITPQFSVTGGPEWYNILLTLTNKCGKDVDFQNSSITFKNSTPLNTNFWGNFDPLTYPDNPLFITSQADPAGGYVASLVLHFPETPWSVTTLNNRENFTIQYGAPSIGFEQSSVKVYLSGTPPQVGSIGFINQTLKPDNISQPYTLMEVAFNGQKINTVPVPWSGEAIIPNLIPGIYTVKPLSVKDSKGNPYEGTAIPTIVTVANNQKVTSNVSYKKISVPGEIKVTNLALPSALIGYTEVPLVTFTRPDTGGSTTEPAPWNTTVSEKEVENDTIYSFSTPDIVFNNYRCKATFTPYSLISSNVNPLTTELSYVCTAIAATKVNINISGVPCGLSKVTVLFKPNDSSPEFSKDVNITEGIGSDSINLVDGVVYGVSSTDIPTYTVTFNPQPLIAKPNVNEVISYFPISHKK